MTDTKLIALQDDLVFEVAVPPHEARQVSSGRLSRVESSLGMVKPLLVKVAEPVVAAWREIAEGAPVESVQIELGLGFEASGRLFITQSTASANLTVRIVFTPRGSGHAGD